MVIELGTYRAVVEIAVKATVLLGAAGLMTMLLRRGRAASRHAWWTAAMVGLLVLPVLTVILPSTSVGPMADVVMPLAVARPVGLPAGAASDVAARPFAPGGDFAEDAIGAESSPVAAVTAPAPAAAPPTVEVTPMDWRLVALCVYGAGVLFFGVPLLLAPWRMQRRLRRLPAQALGDAAVARAHAALGMRRRVPVLLTDALAMPVAVGLLRPVILLPRAAARCPVERLEAVLLHELAHVARRDLQTQALALLARAVYWPHPLAWLAVRQMEIEREKACDDLVIGHGVDAPTYAQTLLEIAMNYQRRPLMRYFAVSMARPSSLESRIRAVLRPGGRRGAIGRGALLGLAVFSLALTAGVATLTAAAPAASPGNVRQQGVASDQSAASATSRAALPEGTVSLVAVAADSQGPFWTADGEPMLLPRGLMVFTNAGPGSRLFILKVHQAEGNASPPIVTIWDGAAMREITTNRLPPIGGTVAQDDVSQSIPSGGGGGAPDANGDVYYQCSYPIHSNAVLKVGIARGEWKTFTEGMHAQSGKVGAASFVIGEPVGRFVRQVGGSHTVVQMELAYTMQNSDVRAVAVFADGSEHPMMIDTGGKEGSLRQINLYLKDATLEQIKTFRFQSRPIEWTTFEHIATEPVTGDETAAAAGKITANTAPISEADAAAELVRAGSQLQAVEGQIEQLKGTMTGANPEMKALQERQAVLAFDVLRVKQIMRDFESREIVAATQAAAIDALPTQDLVQQIKKLQDEMATLATVPHGPYVAGPNGSQETPGLTKHVQEMKAEIERLNAELARRAGG